MDPLSKDELLTHHSGGRHDDVEPSGDDLPSGGVSGRAPKPSQSRVDDDDRDGTFHGFLIRYLGFSLEEIFMGEWAASGEPCGPHTMWWRGKERTPRHHVVWGLRGPPPSLLWTPCT